MPLDDVVEVSNYVAALEYGLARLRGDFPLSARLVREIHAKLLARGRGSEKDPGEFRRSQNWVGGTRRAMRSSCRRLIRQSWTQCRTSSASCTGRRTGCPCSSRPRSRTCSSRRSTPFSMAMAASDACSSRSSVTCGVLRQPLLSLDLLPQGAPRGSTGCSRKFAARETGRPGSPFPRRGGADGQAGTATARRLVQLFEEDRARIQPRGRRVGSALRVHDALEAALVSLRDVARRAGLSYPAAAAGIGGASMSWASPGTGPVQARSRVRLRSLSGAPQRGHGDPVEGQAQGADGGYKSPTPVTSLAVRRARPYSGSHQAPERRRSASTR